VEETWELAALVMMSVEDDTEHRAPLWGTMQMVWMDTDVSLELPRIFRTCAESKYDIAEIEEIYWNEVRPIVSRNLLTPVAPEWAGYDLNWLSDQIVKRLKNGKTYKKSRWRRYSYDYWEKIEEGILQQRSAKS